MAQAADMLIQIWIETTQPVAGNAATRGGNPVHFDGWLELLAVVSELVAAAGGGDVQVVDNPHEEDETSS